ncbi:hypothetical protein HMPREF9004_0604 [Schaalia cardiffensis F0333]|uniref:Uncharacterized protein n=1 Tax=Schaalia cardiffensis F0333 TaxID=888050 RepID=N6W7M1_9ACTO|nr:hypothetical protein HMPREF9004_0604 [Schaalia cardiffensis F0333]
MTPHSISAISAEIRQLATKIADLRTATEDLLLEETSLMQVSVDAWRARTRV